MTLGDCKSKGGDAALWPDGHQRSYPARCRRTLDFPQREIALRLRRRVSSCIMSFSRVFRRAGDACTPARTEFCLARRHKSTSSAPTQGKGSKSNFDRNPNHKPSPPPPHSPTVGATSARTLRSLQASEPFGHAHYSIVPNHRLSRSIKMHHQAS